MTPKKYPQNFYSPKIFIFLKTQKNIEIQKFDPKKMDRAYVCIKISEYPPPPLGAIIGRAAERHLNGVSLAGRWWPNIESLLGSCVILQGIRTSIVQKPYIFVIFQGGSGPPVPPPLDPHMFPTMCPRPQSSI